jgi:hypothetical protein
VKPLGPLGLRLWRDNADLAVFWGGAALAFGLYLAWVDAGALGPRASGFLVRAVLIGAGTTLLVAGLLIGRRARRALANLETPADS